MRAATNCVVAIVLALSCATASAAQSGGRQTKMYKWVDDQGVVHIGDQVPPEYAGKDRKILNNSGIPVANERGAITPEEHAQQRAATAKVEEERKKDAAARLRDQVLLDTYLSTSEIEALRDRRLEIMASQIKMTEAYLEYLRAKQRKLKTEAQDFRPYSSNPKAPPIDDKLAAELTETMNSILAYEKNLGDAKQRQTMVVAQFASDLQRFKELKAAQATAGN